MCVHKFAYTSSNAEFCQESESEVKHRWYQWFFFEKCTYFILLGKMLFGTTQSKLLKEHRTRPHVLVRS